MEPFRSPQPACARCGAPKPDHFSPNGDLVCHACAALPAIDAQLAKGKRDGVAGSIVALVIGIALLLGTFVLGIPSFSHGASFGNRFTSRLMGLGVGVGLVLIIVAVRNLRTYSNLKRP